MSVRGFKSLKNWEDYKPGSLNILIGANGAGKSNFIDFFRLMSWMMQSKLQLSVGERGGASKLLHDGTSKTREIEGKICIRTKNGDNEYAFRLFFAAGDSLVFAEESYRFSKAGKEPYRWNELGAGHKESDLVRLEDKTSHSEEGHGFAKFILSLLRGCRVYQFHDTSSTARMKQRWPQEDRWFLKEDAGNLASVLLHLRDNWRESYQQIVLHCRRLLPFFDDFVLNPLSGYVILQWKELKSDLVFDASSASDGMLRVFALLTLLCQPAEEFPDVLILDEPELGLHPAAIELVAGLIRSASSHTQVIAATQSATLLNHFQPEEITIIEREGRESRFKKLGTAELSDWLEDYTLSDIWQKNLIGGRP